jgi:DNA transposition AAA+ family ATPase
MAPLDEHQAPSGADTRDPHAELKERVRAALKAGGVSQAQLGRQIDLSQTVVSQFLAGTYPGAVDAVAARMAAWLDGAADRSRTMGAVPETPRFLATPTAKKILAGLSYAHTLGDIVVICGGAGLGKTTTVEHFREQRPAVFVFTANPTTSGMVPFLDRLSQAVGVREPQSRTPSALFDEIVERLAPTRGLLAVDEAQHLATQSLEALRSLHDRTGIGLALLGNDVVYDRLHGSRGSQGFAQLFSRIGMVVKLTRAAKGDVDLLAKALSFADDASLGFLRDKASQPGALRGVVKAARFAHVLAAGDGVPTTFAHLEQAWAQLERPAVVPAAVR